MRVVSVHSVQTRTCAHCAALTADRRVFRMKDARGLVLNCLGCAVRDGRLLRRAALTALVVGTILTLINQGPAIFGGDIHDSLAWKIPLTYSVPFLVVTFGALANAAERLRGGPQEDGSPRPPSRD